MAGFETKRLPSEPDVIAPDGSGVRVLLALAGGLAAARQAVRRLFEVCEEGGRAAALFLRAPDST